MTGDRAPLLLACALCTFGAFRVAPNITGSASTCIRTPDHDISPSVERQLVLELELRKLGGEGLHILPSRRCRRLALPEDQDLADAPRQAETNGALRLWSHGTMQQRWKGRRCVRSRTVVLLQQSYVENVMDASAGRQRQPNRHLVDEFGDLIRPEEPGLELAGGLLGQRRRRTLLEAQEHPVAHLEHNMAMYLVVVQLLRRLSLFQPVTNIGEELFTLLHAFSDGRDACFPRFIRPDGRGITSIDDAEGCITQRRLVGRVEDELGPRQPPQPVAWPISRETP